jgi:hypothetical protein
VKEAPPLSDSWNAKRCQKCHGRIWLYGLVCSACNSAYHAGCGARLDHCPYCLAAKGFALQGYTAQAVALLLVTLLIASATMRPVTDLRARPQLTSVPVVPSYARVKPIPLPRSAKAAVVARSELTLSSPDRSRLIAGNTDSTIMVYSVR